ncbi:MAG: hypothetical protein NTV10_00230 [Methanoregula sp.]|nr:hypothetical protein [Methanoregula sp.]
MAIDCDICGFINTDHTHFCGKCGVDLRKTKDSESKNENQTIIQKNDVTSSNHRKNKTIEEHFRVIKWCVLKGIGFPYFLILIVACQSFCPKIVTVFMSAFKSTGQVLAGESDNGDQDQSSRIL